MVPPVQQAVRRLLYLVAFVGAGFLGRATIVDGQALALVWPAAGVALLWFLGGPRGRWTWVDAALLAGATFAVNGLTGSSPQMSAVFVLANLAQVVTIVALTRRWAPGLTGPEAQRRLDSPRTLSRFLVAIVLGCLVGVAIGAGGMWLVTGFHTNEATLTWLGRNASGALGVATTGILLLRWWSDRRAGTGPHASGGGPVELVALLAATASLFLVELWSENLPLAFLLPAMTAWAGMRFSSVVVAAHALAGGGAAVALTLLAHGPFGGVDDVYVSALLSQLFVGMTVMIALFLAMAREESARLQEGLLGSQRHAAAQNELLEAIISSMTEGVVVVGSDGRIVLCNPAAAPLLPVPPEQAPGYDATLVPLRAGPVGRRPAGTPLTLQELREQRQDVVAVESEDDRVFAAAARPLDAGPDGDRGAVVVFHDVTGDREHARELSSFAGVVAHDLLNPIGAVGGWAMMLEDSLADTAHRSPELGMVRRIRSTAGRMEDLVNDLLADARARDRRLTLGTVDLEALLEEIVAGRDATNAVVVGDLPLVRGDTMLLRQLLDNLVGNALKYVRPGQAPDVEVVGRLRSGDVLLTVSDRGVGIPEGEHELVFRRFHRAHPDGEPGTGLGLAICRSIVERHGGTIRALPRHDGPGTVFEVVLPAAERANAVTA